MNSHLPSDPFRVLIATATGFSVWFRCREPESLARWLAENPPSQGSQWFVCFTVVVTEARA